jgi:tight adherence protein B
LAAIIAVATFVITGGLFLLTWLFVSAPSEQEMVRNRIQAVRNAERRGDVPLDLQLLRDEMLSSVPVLNRVMMNLAWTTKMQSLLSQAGMRAKPGKILLASAVAGLATYVIVDGTVHLALVAAPAALVATVAPLGFVSWKRKRRLRQFEERFPDALDLLGRAVRAGHAFTTGLEIVAKETAEPVASEFRTCFEEQNFGLPMRDALVNLTERMPVVDVRFFVTALLVQKETGGNLAEILDELARVIRDRFRIYREVRVKTAQGRLTAGILIALPIFMLFALEAVNPAYVRVLFDDPIGPPVLAIAGLMQLIGSILIWRIVHIEV